MTTNRTTRLAAASLAALVIIVIAGSYVFPLLAGLLFGGTR